jgi:hypothetical protein
VTTYLYSDDIHTLTYVGGYASSWRKQSGQHGINFPPSPTRSMRQQQQQQYALSKPNYQQYQQQSFPRSPSTEDSSSRLGRQKPWEGAASSSIAKVAEWQDQYVVHPQKLQPPPPAARGKRPRSQHMHPSSSQEWQSSVHEHWNSHTHNAPFPRRSQGVEWQMGPSRSDREKGRGGPYTHPSRQQNQEHPSSDWHGLQRKWPDVSGNPLFDQ